MTPEVEQRQPISSRTTLGPAAIFGSCADDNPASPRAAEYPDEKERVFVARASRTLHAPASATHRLPRIRQRQSHHRSHTRAGHPSRRRRVWRGRRQTAHPCSSAFRPHQKHSPGRPVAFTCKHTPHTAPRWPHRHPRAISLVINAITRRSTPRTPNGIHPRGSADRRKQRQDDKCLKRRQDELQRSSLPRTSVSPDISKVRIGSPSHEHIAKNRLRIRSSPQTASQSKISSERSRNRARSLDDETDRDKGNTEKRERIE
ncbi:hypothetical protein DFH09DRAFT_1272750 [Mycena vulgaris]|nr:hypothetical protein DFH09DRAFT_1272750 [Mycena vulgaris]